MSKDFYRLFKISYWLRRFFVSNLSRFFFSNKKIRKNTFKHIYISNYWQNNFKINENMSKSGPGSNINYTTNLIEELIVFFKKKNINTILDVGCGDFIWMNLLLKKYKNYNKYLGLEIVDNLVANNNLKYSNDKVSFKTFDLVEEKIPTGFDIILVRDVFIHLKDEQIKNFLKLLTTSEAKYFGVTSTPLLRKNFELKTEGRYRDINIEIEPYNFTNYILKINEKNKSDTFNIYQIQN